MRLYLSSYKTIGERDKFIQLVPAGNHLTAFVPNALDFASDLERRAKSEQADTNQLRGFGLIVETLDLRDYFGRENELKSEMAKYGVIWVRGGNLFVLRQAMRLSGFDNILKELAQKPDLLYGGYSAGVCVLAPTLKGIDLMDDISQKPYGDKVQLIWDGLGIIPFSIVPHFNSDHPESALASKSVQYMIDHHMPFKALRDGEVITANSPSELKI